MENTLLLAATYEPVSVISWKSAIKLLFLNKVEVIEEYDQELHSTYLVIKMPAVVRLLSVFKKKNRRVKFSRINIYTRDRFRCQFCGKSGDVKDFTFDHVIPRARGGKTEWENIVTCCVKCNIKKADRTPQEAGMRLIKKPKRPTWLPAVTIRINQRPVPEQWVDYLYWNSTLTE